MSLPPSKPSPARHRSGARSARSIGCLSICTQTHRREIMSLHSWLKKIRSNLASSRRSLRAAKHRLHLEPLEERRLLAFSTPVAYAVGDFPTSVVAADFNGDNRMDLAVVNNLSSSVSVLHGNGNGAFAAVQTQNTVAVGGSCLPVSVAVGDFNHVDRPDLITTNFDDLSLLLNNGDGTFAPPQRISVGLNSPSVAVGDFNA